jgi:hypothetical protein
MDHQMQQKYAQEIPRLDECRRWSLKDTSLCMVISAFLFPLERAINCSPYGTRTTLYPNKSIHGKEGWSWYGPEEEERPCVAQ